MIVKIFDIVNIDIGQDFRGLIGVIYVTLYLSFYKRNIVLSECCLIK